MRQAWKNMSRSDRVVAFGGPVIGLLALAAGVSTSDLATALFGAVALGTGLAFAIPLVRAGGRPREGDTDRD
jgi:hypothetical protein